MERSRARCSLGKQSRRRIVTVQELPCDRSLGLCQDREHIPPVGSIEIENGELVGNNRHRCTVVHIPRRRCRRNCSGAQVIDRGKERCDQPTVQCERKGYCTLDQNQPTKIRLRQRVRTGSQVWLEIDETKDWRGSPSATTRGCGVYCLGDIRDRCGVAVDLGVQLPYGIV